MNKSLYIYNLYADGFIQISLNCNQTKMCPSVLLSEVYFILAISQNKKEED